MKQAIRKEYKVIKMKRLKYSPNDYHHGILNNSLKVLNSHCNSKQEKNYELGSYIPIIDKEIIPPFLNLTEKYSFPYFSKQQKQMTFRRYSFQQNWKVKNFNIIIPNNHSEIVIPNYVFVPLISFDSDLNRVGYGGGYYDHYIKKVRQKKINVLFIGIGLDILYIKDRLIQTNQFDEKLDVVVTESTIYKRYMNIYLNNNQNN